MIFTLRCDAREPGLRIVLDARVGYLLQTVPCTTTPGSRESDAKIGTKGDHFSISARASSLSVGIPISRVWFPPLPLDLGPTLCVKIYATIGALSMNNDDAIPLKGNAEFLPKAVEFAPNKLSMLDRPPPPACNDYPQRVLGHDLPKVTGDEGQLSRSWHHDSSVLSANLWCCHQSRSNIVVIIGRQ
jgi:hypothetical protein